MSLKASTVSKKILIADDEEDILEIISFQLLKEGFDIKTAKDGNQALALITSFNPDMVLLDIMMPFKTGIEVCEILRTNPKFNDTLIVFLTALNDDETHIKCLELGADDFITKPISPKIIATKVNTLFRRYKDNLDADAENIITINTMQINGGQYTVTNNGTTTVLARKEFELLQFLASNTKRIFLRNEILDKVWGSEVIVGDRTIDVHIRKIRLKLNVDCIITVKGVGYRFNENF